MAEEQEKGDQSEAIAFDQRLGLLVRQLLDDCGLGHRVKMTSRPAMYNPERRVITLIPVHLERWSSGERLIWAFGASLGGLGEVNLAEVASALRGSPKGRAIASTFALFMAPSTGG